MNQSQSVPISQEEVNSIVWRACATLRGAHDVYEYKNYILTILFWIYLSHQGVIEPYNYLARNQDGEDFTYPDVYERVTLPVGTDFASLYEQRDSLEIGEKINWALSSIEKANPEKLEGIFYSVDFSLQTTLWHYSEKPRRLRGLLEAFSDPKLQAAFASHDAQDIFAGVYEFLLDRFATEAKKYAGEFYTPKEVSQLLALLVDPQPGDRIYDPACGTGSSLIEVASQIPKPSGNHSKNYALYGQEINSATWALCRMNLFVHGEGAATIAMGNTLTAPQFLDNGHLMKFEVVVSNPPFSLSNWGVERASDEERNSRGFNRFFRGLPPARNADYAFISHIVESTVRDKGRAAILAPYGVLFRAGQEGKIRQQLLEEKLLDAVIGLPPNLFFGISIPTTILVFKRQRITEDVMFIDASKDFQNERKQNKLRPNDIKKIIDTYRGRVEIEEYSYIATFSEIQMNDFNLNITRFVKATTAQQSLDIVGLQNEIEGIEEELDQIRKQMNLLLKDL